MNRPGLFHLEQTSNKKSDRVGLTGRYFISQIMSGMEKSLHIVGRHIKPNRKASLGAKRLHDLRPVDGG